MQNCNFHLIGFGAQIGALSIKKKGEEDEKQICCCFCCFYRLPWINIKTSCCLEPAAFQLQKFSLRVSVFNMMGHMDAAISRLRKGLVE